MFANCICGSFICSQLLGVSCLVTDGFPTQKLVGSSQLTLILSIFLVYRVMSLSFMLVSASCSLNFVFWSFDCMDFLPCFYVSFRTCLRVSGGPFSSFWLERRSIGSFPSRMPAWSPSQLQVLELCRLCKYSKNGCSYLKGTFLLFWWFLHYNLLIMGDRMDIKPFLWFYSRFIYR